MRRIHYTEGHTAAILHEVDAGVPVADLLRNHGIARRTFNDWKSECGGIGASDNGSVFWSHRLDVCAYAHGTELRFIQTGRSIETYYIEGLDGRVREE